MSAPRWNNKDSGNLSALSVSSEPSVSETILSRNLSQEKLETSPLQNQVDGLVSGFVDQATDWKSIAAMTTGGLAYRWGKITVLSPLSEVLSRGYFIPQLIRGGSVAFGLASEVSAFELTHRSLQTLTTDHGPRTMDLWSWSGPGGWKEGLLTSFVTFGTLKGFGKLAEGQNLILQHGFQDAGMVVGHQLIAQVGMGPKPEGTLAEQFVHYEGTNLQIGVGMALGHALSDGKVFAIERGMDLSLQMKSPPTPLFQRGGTGARAWGDFSPALALNLRPGTKNSFEKDNPISPPTYAMASRKDGGGGDLVPRTEENISLPDRLQKIEREFLSHNGEERKKALATLQDLIPQMTEEDRLALALRVLKVQDRFSYQVREDLIKFIHHVFLQLSESHRPLLLQGVEQGLKNSWDEGLPAVEIMADLIPQLEPQDRLPWALRIKTEREVTGGPSQDRLAEVFKRLISQLQGPDRLSLALYFATTLKEKRVSVQRILREIVDPLSESQRLELVLKVEEYLADPDHASRRSAVNLLREMIPFLAPADRLPRIANIEQRLYDEDYLVRRDAAGALRRIIPHLSENDRLGPTQKILGRLFRNEEKEWELFISYLEDIFRRLSPPDYRVLAEEAQKELTHENWYFRRLSLVVLEKLIPHLPPAELSPLGPLPEARMTDEEPFVRPRAVSALGALARHVPESERLAWALKIAEKWAEDFKNLNYAANAALQYAVALLPTGDRPRLVQKIEEKLDHPNWEFRKSALDFLKVALRYLKPHQRLDHFLKIEERLRDEEEKVQEEAWKILKDEISLLSTSPRIQLLESMVRNQGLSDLKLSFLPLLLRRVPPQALLDYAEESKDEDLKIVVPYLASGLPIHVSSWEAYLKTEDRPRFLRENAEKVTRFRRGAPLSFHDPDELLLAYAGLDSPEGLSFETFRRMIRLSLPLKPFLDRSFEAQVLERRSAHQLIDKGKITQAIHFIKEIRDPWALERFIQGLKKSDPRVFKKIGEEMAELETLLEKAGANDLSPYLSQIKKILPKIWEFRNSAPLKKLIARFLLILGWQRDGIDELKEKMEVALKHKVSSEIILEGLKGAEEFYQDTLEEVGREMGIPIDQIPSLKKQRNSLRAERERAAGEIGEKVLVEFIPSRSQADQFFGYVGEDCTKSKGESVFRNDFQIYRMIAQDRLVGMLYVQKFRVSFFKKALVLAVQPRSSWETDQRLLLRTVEEHLSRIAKAEGYDYVLLMNDRNQQSNRQDMLAAILREDYPTLTLRKTIDGTVFKGNQFLVLWKKGQAIRQSPPIVFLPPPLPKEEDFETLEDEDLLDVELLPEETVPEKNPPPLPLEILRREPQALPARPIRVLLDERPDRETLSQFQHLIHNMMAEASRNLPVRQRRRMMQALNAEFLDEVRRAFAEAGVPAPFGLAGPGGGVGYDDRTRSDTQLMKIPPAQLVKYGALMIKPNELLPPGALVLRRRSLESILSDPRITRTEKGWFEPTLRGKAKVVKDGEVVGEEGTPEAALARGDEVSIQDLFDFYNVIFYQGYQFRGYLRLLQNRGADIQPLADIVGGLSQKLDEGLEHLFARRFPEALSVLQEVDPQVTRFQEAMRQIAHTVGLEVDPVTGMIYPRRE